MMPGERYEVIIDFAGAGWPTGTYPDLAAEEQRQDPLPGRRGAARHHHRPRSCSSGSAVPQPCARRPATTRQHRHAAALTGRHRSCAWRIRRPGPWPPPCAEDPPAHPQRGDGDAQRHRPGDRRADRLPRRPAGDPGQQHQVERRTVPDGDSMRLRPAGFDPRTAATTYYSELPKEGDTEVWEIVNLTADAHPIHLHLVQFQLMNRQTFNVKQVHGGLRRGLPRRRDIDPMTGLPYPAGVFIPATARRWPTIGNQRPAASWAATRTSAPARTASRCTCRGRPRRRCRRKPAGRTR